MSITMQTELSTGVDAPEAGFIRFIADGASLKYKTSDNTTFTLSTGVTPEEVEDIVAAMIQPGSSKVTVTYNDPSDQLFIDIVESEINHDALQGFVANEHIDHSSVSMLAGTGLTGGGDLTANRTFNLGDTAVTPGTYGGLVGVPEITIDAQGRITNASNGPALVLGDHFQTLQDLSVFATTSNTPVEAYSLTTNSLDTGFYRVGYTLRLAPGATNADDVIDIRVGGTSIEDLDYQVEGKDSGNDQRVPYTGFVYYTVAVVGTIDLEVYVNQTGGGTTEYHGVRFEIWRATP